MSFIIDLDLLEDYWRKKRTDYALIVRSNLLHLPPNAQFKQTLEERKQVLFARQSRYGHWNGSISETTQSIELLLGFGLTPDHERLQLAAKWLSKQQSSKAVVSGLPLPSERELKPPGRLFTGQAAGSVSSHAFQVGMIGLRGLWLLGYESKALTEVEDQLFALLAKPPSWLCCLNLATSYYAIGACPRLVQAPFVSEGLSRILAAERLPGQWRGTLKPWYMYLVLSEWPGAPARRLATTDTSFLKRAQKRDGSFSRGYYTEQRTYAVTKLLHAAGLLDY